MCIYICILYLSFLSLSLPLVLSLPRMLLRSQSSFALTLALSLDIFLFNPSLHRLARNIISFVTTPTTGVTVDNKRDDPSLKYIRGRKGA